jgi:hypothetical protein
VSWSWLTAAYLELDAVSGAAALEDLGHGESAVLVSGHFVEGQQLGD